MIYLDNAATTQASKGVAKEMIKYLTQEFGNPSSMHSKGSEARKAIERARRKIAESIGAKRTDIIFTSGGSESNNLALKGVMRASDKKHLITTRVEHTAIIETCEQLEKEGFSVTYLEVDEEGKVNPEDVKKNITEDTVLVSVMLVNNEIGTIQPMQEIGQICKENNVLLHVDAIQGFMKACFDVDKYNVDLASISAHKIHGPKGIGALYVREGVEIEKLINGGPHESDLRAGTQNVSGIMGFAKAIEEFTRVEVERITSLKNELINGLLEIQNSKLNGPVNRLCNNVNIRFKNVDAVDLMSHLDHKKIFVSAGSACTSQTLKPSHVLKAIGLSDEEARSSIRLTLGRFNTREEIENVVQSVKIIVESLRKIRELEV